MTRSKLRKFKRAGAMLAGVPIASVFFGQAPNAYGQEATDSGGLEEIIVTAEKRTENLQNVPVSITTIGNEQLQQLHVEDLIDYMKMLPSTSIQALGPGNNRIFMRGIASGDYPNHSASLPSVGMYLDEQPITTILGSVDLHVYDIQRVEALAGPQGTLYGASSEAGTIRIITNKPDPKGFSASYDAELNDVYNGTLGGIAEGYVNLPITSNAAVRIVAWYEKDSGFIDNAPNTLTYPATPTSPAFTINNDGLAKKHYNDSETYGGRAALKIDLNDSWSITPSLISQITESNGIFSEELVRPALAASLSAPVGDYQVSHFLPESAMDDFTDATLTVEGKLANLDIVYAGSYMKRHNFSYADYTDYSLAYLNNYNNGALWHNTSGTPIVPSQYIVGGYKYELVSDELRVSTPQNDPLRFVGGGYLQRQQNHILQDYQINGVDGQGLDSGNGSVPSESVPGWANAWWLTDELRVDRDWALFGELSYDFLPNLTGTVGLRWFKFDNSINGFYGVNSTNALLQQYFGVYTCPNPTVKWYDAPCEDLVQPDTSSTGTIPKYNLTWHIDDSRMIYGTVSRGFRPGGINRIVPQPYQPDFLTNYEFGWKTDWFNHSLRFNGALFLEDWKNFQFSFLGPNSVTIIANAAQARSKGVETELQWAATHNLTLTANAAYTDARLTANYCGSSYAPGVTNCPSPAAPSGTQLPVTPPFKANLTARYTFPLGTLNGYAEAAVVAQDAVWSDLRLSERQTIGQQPGYSTVDLTFGAEAKSYHFEIFAKNLFNETVELYRYAECTPGTCGPYAIYAGLGQPRLIGVKYGQSF